MKNTLLLMALLATGGASVQAQTLVDVQFGGNDYGAPGAVQSGVGLIGSAGDIWNDYTSTSALQSGVNVLQSDLSFTGTTLTVTSTGGIYQYADGLGSASDRLTGSSVGSLASAELGAGSSLTLSLNALAANTSYQIYLLSSPDRWERSSSWSVNGGTAQVVGPLNGYQGPYNHDDYGNSNVPGYAPDVPVAGINYLVLSGTTDSSGNLLIAGKSVSGDVDINGFQLQAIAAAPEPSTYALMLSGLAVLVWFQTSRRKLNA